MLRVIPSFTAVLLNKTLPPLRLLLLCPSPLALSLVCDERCLFFSGAKSAGRWSADSPLQCRGKDQ